ncbi:MAG: DUF63 family protein [Halobacteriaceae archaeon]
MVLPSGTQLPPLLHGVVVAFAAAAVGATLYRARPRVESTHVVALAPWMVTGAALYVLSQVGAVAGPLAPFLGSPTVYVTTGVAAGTTWLAARRTRMPVPRTLAAVGTGAALAASAAAVWWGVEQGSLRPWPSVASVLATAALAGSVWVALDRIRPAATGTTGAAGLLVVVGHTLDAVSTAVGVGHLGVAEQTPLSRAVIEAGSALPAAPYVGGAWLFIVVKAALAAGLVVLFTEYVREEPTPANLLLALLAAVGLGPGAHNVVLFAIVG